MKLNSFSLLLFEFVLSCSGFFFFLFFALGREREHVTQACDARTRCLQNDKSVYIDIYNHTHRTNATIQSSFLRMTHPLLCFAFESTGQHHQWTLIIFLLYLMPSLSFIIYLSTIFFPYFEFLCWQLFVVALLLLSSLSYFSPISFQMCKSKIDPPLQACLFSPSCLVCSSFFLR